MGDPTFREPFRSAFRELIVSGTGRIDIYDSGTSEGYAVAGTATAAYLDREVGRVELHLRHIVRYLQQRIAPTEILDVGCGTGGLTVALALAFPNANVLGVDPARRSLDAANIRANGYDVPRVAFTAIPLNGGIDLASARFDLVTCTSVLEFITTESDREALIRDIQRVVAPGGYVFITTPNPAWPRELHSGRWFGNQRRKAGYPWALSRLRLRSLFRGWTLVPLDERVHDKVPFSRMLPTAVSRAIERLGPWQLLLFQRSQ